MRRLLFFNIENNYEGSNASASHIDTNNNYCTINYADRWMEAIDKIEKLFERFQQVEKEKNELLQKLLDGKKTYHIIKKKLSDYVNFAELFHTLTLKFRSI